GAQARPVTRPELRVDATSAHVSRLEGSLGAVVPMGIYARLALSAGGGVARVEGESRRAARADAIARFELDPLRQRARSVYLGGGVTYFATEKERGRGYLALVAGWELKTRAGWVPTIEAGLGGGARLGVTLKRGMESWR
ncbi:MAG TPA: hypothetical protein VF761_04385, partial [Gemmatimonadaceae bacterium]